MEKRCILLASFLLAVLVLPVSAQQPAGTQKINLSVEAGVTSSWASWDLSRSYDEKSLFGGIVGLRAEYGLSDHIWLQSGVRLISKGAKSEHGSTTATTKTFRPVYLEIPITIAYKHRLSPKMTLFGSVGGYLAEGIWGQYQYKVERSSAGTKTETYNVFASGGLKRFDAGLTGGLGAEYGRFILRADYEMGLLNAVSSSTAVNTDSFKNHSVSVSLGYKFQ